MTFPLPKIKILYLKMGAPLEEERFLFGNHHDFRFQPVTFQGCMMRLKFAWVERGFTIQDLICSLKIQHSNFVSYTFFLSVHFGVKNPSIWWWKFGGRWTKCAFHQVAAALTSHGLAAWQIPRGAQSGRQMTKVMKDFCASQESYLKLEKWVPDRIFPINCWMK